MFFYDSGQDSLFDVSKLTEEIPEVNWVPYGLRLRLTEDRKLEVWNIDDEVNQCSSYQHSFHSIRSQKSIRVFDQYCATYYLSIE